MNSQTDSVDIDEVELEEGAELQDEEDTPSEDTAAPPPAPPEEEEDDVAEFSRRTQKRIAKEVQKRKRLEDELYNVKHQLAELARQRQQESAQNSQNTLADLKKRRTQALAEGDTEEFDRLDEMYLNARDEERARQYQQRQQPQQQAPQPEEPQLPAAAQRWLGRNSWYTQDRARAQIADQIATSMHQEGYEIDDDFYEELDARMRRSPAARQQQSVIAPNRGGGTPPAAGSKITKNDLEAMRRNGLDPNNATHRKAWLDAR